MKYIAFFLSLTFIAFLILGIKNNTISKTSNMSVQDSIRTWKIQDSIQILIADTLLNPEIVLYQDKYDKITFKKFFIDSVEKYYPKILDTNWIYSPNEIIDYVDYSEMREKKIGSMYFFGSEAGQDEFYIIYGYLLKQKTKNQYPKLRKQLFEAYQQINRYYGNWNNGGTYFGHQSWRIIGFVEFDILNYINYEKEQHIQYDYRLQKRLFINMLRQRAIDKMSSEFYHFDKSTKAKLLDAVQKIDKCIDNCFTLQKVMLFEKRHYVYE